MVVNYVTVPGKSAQVMHFFEIELRRVGFELQMHYIFSDESKVLRSYNH